MPGRSRVTQSPLRLEGTQVIAVNSAEGGGGGDSLEYSGHSLGCGIALSFPQLLGV